MSAIKWLSVGSSCQGGTNKKNKKKRVGREKKKTAWFSVNNLFCNSTFTKIKIIPWLEEANKEIKFFSLPFFLFFLTGF